MMTTSVTIEERTYELADWMHGLLDGNHRFVNWCTRSNNRTMKVFEAVRVKFKEVILTIERGSEVTFYRHPDEEARTAILCVVSPNGDSATLHGDGRIMDRSADRPWIKTERPRPST